MSKKISLFIALIMICEISVFFWSNYVSDLDTVKYQLAARYSARITLLLFSALLLWTGFLGLKKIYNKEEHRKGFVLLVLMITINHVIHFGYVAINYWVNDFDLFVLRSLGGVMGYFVLIMAPIYLWKRAALTKMLYWKVTISMLVIASIMFLSYIGRWNKGLPLASTKELYVGFLVGSGIMIAIMIYRVFAERKIKYAAV